ncbi:MAG: flavodoxin domain-containing protein [Marinifilaceae bacterium]|jgi:flavodoxin I|nr:flavodoxin domain-containing protein [Marinifilaceae bacterium]
MNRIALVFFPESGNVEKVSRIIGEKLRFNNVDFLVASDFSLEQMNKYDLFIMGISTVGTHNWSDVNDNNVWDKFMTNVEAMDLSNKFFAFFGLGDHIAYPHNFVDSMGDLYLSIKKTGAHVIGKINSEGYTFKDSRAFIDGGFVGLPVDEDHESKKTNQRVDNWLEQLKKELIDCNHKLVLE